MRVREGFDTSFSGTRALYATATLALVRGGVVISRLPTLAVTTLILDIVLGLSIEQLVTALKMRLSIEYAKVQLTISPVAKLAAEVWFSEPQGNCRVLAGILCRLTLWRNESKRFRMG